MHTFSCAAFRQNTHSTYTSTTQGLVDALSLSAKRTMLPRFQMANLRGMESINNEAIKELSVRCTSTDDPYPFGALSLSALDSVPLHSLLSRYPPCSNCRLTKIEAIDYMVKLKRLWAGKNAIKKVSLIQPQFSVVPHSVVPDWSHLYQTGCMSGRDSTVWQHSSSCRWKSISHPWIC